MNGPMDEPANLALFEQTIVPHMNAAYNVAFWLTRNAHDAEDVVQEAYLRAFRFFGGVKGKDGKAPRPPLVRHTCLTLLGREHPRRDGVPLCRHNKSAQHGTD